MGGEGDARNDVDLAVGERLLLRVGSLIIGDLIRQVFRIEIADDLAIARRGRFLQAYAQHVLRDEVVLAQRARRECAERGVHRAVAVARDLAGVADVAHALLRGKRDADGRALGRVVRLGHGRDGQEKRHEDETTAPKKMFDALL